MATANKLTIRHALDARHRRAATLLPNRALGIGRPLTWAEAISWLERGMTEFMNDSDRRWARIMINVASMDGVLPGVISAILGPDP